VSVTDSVCIRQTEPFFVKADHHQPRVYCASRGLKWRFAAAVNAATALMDTYFRLPTAHVRRSAEDGLHNHHLERASLSFTRWQARRNQSLRTLRSSPLARRKLR
jgi:hypothetical protein